MADTASSPANGAFIKGSPVAAAVKEQSSKTAAELSNLSNARNAPTTPAATGQPLTHYHSFFSELLSWNNPRASAITYASIVSLIVAIRYLDVIRWGLKLTYMLLGITVAAEVAGKAVLNNGLASQLRPRKYYTIPRESLDSIISDVHELLNFFVIEAQRVMFVENVYASITACVAAFLSYYLVRIMPYWGLALVGSTVLFFAPLIYKTNQELIDAQVKQATEIVNAQTSQIREVANKHTAHATELTKQYMGDYTAKAQQMLRGNKATAPAVPAAAAAAAAAPSAPTTEPVKQYGETDFPAAPKADLAGEPALSETEPVIAS